MFVINEIIKNDNEYERIKEIIKNEIKLSIDNRNDEILFKLNKDDSDEEAFQCTKGNLLTMLILSLPFNRDKSKEITEELLFDTSDIEEYKNYYDKLIVLFTDNLDLIKKCFIDITSELNQISSIINYHYGTSISLYSFIDLMKSNERINKLLDYSISNVCTFKEIEKNIKRNTDEIIDIIKNHDSIYNTLKPYFLSHSGINPKQFSELVSPVGCKPDLMENVIPLVIQNSFLKGLTPKEFYVNAKGARKAIVTNFIQVKESGYLTRQLSFLTMDEKFEFNKSGDITESCSNENFIEITINNKESLKRFHDRYFINDDDELQLINKNDTHLIGKKIKLKSPITCGCKNGICKKCYGELYKINKDYNIGMIAVLLLTNPITQGLLSTKHNLQINSVELKWSDIFNEYFINDKNLIYCIKDTKIKISSSDIEEKGFSKFHILKGDEKEEITTSIPLEINEELEVTMKENSEDTEYFINLSRGDFAFNFVMANNGLSAPLLKIKRLLENNEIIKNNTKEFCLEYFIELLNESKLNIMSIHAEIILRSMNKNGELCSIKEAVLKSESPFKSLMFEQIKKQLRSIDTFEKDGDSLLEQFF